MSLEIKPCPVCGVPCETYTDYIDGHTLCESSVECKHCGYVYDFSYGVTLTVIDGREFVYSYHDTEENRQTQKDIRVAFAEFKARIAPAAPETKG